MNIIVAGLSHKTSPVELRERLAFPKRDLPQALEKLKVNPGVNECFILSTCNRVEIYAVVKDAGTGIRFLKEFLSAHHNLELKEFEGSLYSYSEPESIRHIFAVASSLDAMVVGEAEILGQLKEAYAVAHAAGFTRGILNGLLQRSFSVAKEIRTITDIDHGAVSVSSVAVGLAERIFGTLRDKTVLILGAGETSELTAKHLLENGAKSILVSNRTHSRAVDLAAKFKGEAIRFEDCPEKLAWVDIVISSTASPHYVLTKEHLAGIMPRRKQRPVFLIDIAVPRDIDPAVNQLDNVYLYNIDDLKEMADTNLNMRYQEMEKARNIIERHVEKFMVWLDSLQAAPAIQKLGSVLEEIRIKELQKSLGKLKTLTPEQQEEIEYLSKRIINRVFHLPASRIKEKSEEKDGYTYVEALRYLFELYEDKDKP